MLDPMTSAEPGQWQTDRVPYVREWMDSCGLAWVRNVTVVASTQVGKTEAMNNVGGYYIHQRPSPVMFVMPTRDTARMVTDRRIMPMVRASAALREEMTGLAHDTKKREIVFRRSIIYMRSANSATDLASVPVRLVLGDEVDKWPRWAGREASPLKLVKERTHTFPDHVVFIASTPTTRQGVIWKQFKQGDQRRRYLPCPHCDHLQVLRWDRIKWDSKAITTAKEMRHSKTAHYECKQCNGKINDHHKREMNLRGVWVPEAWKDDVQGWLDTGSKLDREEHRSYHIWAAYSPWVTFWRIVEEFLASRADPADMMNLTNSWFAELWEERVDNTTDAAVAACKDDRASFECDENVRVITAAVDVQKDRLEWCVTGWLNDEQSQVVAVGKIPKMAGGGDWDELADVLLRNTWGPSNLKVRCCVVDSRYRRDEVIDFVRLYRPVVQMIAGVERDSPLPFGTVKVDKHPRTGQTLPQSLTVWTINVGWFKDIVAARIMRALSEPNTVAGRIGLPNDLDPEWVGQISSEHKVVERSGSKAKARWVKKPGKSRNEAWDLLVYNAAAARMIHVDKLLSEERQAKRPHRPRPPARPTSAKGKRSPMPRLSR